MESTKKCASCGRDIENDAKFCPFCGATSAQTPPPAEQPMENPSPAPQVSTLNASAYPATDLLLEETPRSENVVAGTVGAFLFALIGGLLYFVCYQVGFIAGICGLVIFVLAHFGYSLFTHSKNSTSTVGNVISVIMMILVIFLSEYFCLSFEIYQVFHEEYAITFFEAVRATPEFLAEGEILGAVIQDLAVAYVLGFIAFGSMFFNKKKSRKKKEENQ